MTSKLQEHLQLLKTSWIFKAKRLLQWVKTICRYYGSSEFRKKDIYRTQLYWMRNPFLISKDYLAQVKAEDIYTYGETPLTTLELISKEANIQHTDIVYDLGCSTGQTSFWLHDFIGCEVVGIEIIPEFVKNAERIQTKHPTPKVTFKNEDFLTADYHKATVIYLYGTCLSRDCIEALIRQFEGLNKGTKVITVSYSLFEFSTKAFREEKSFLADFYWGRATVHIQIKI